MTVIIVTGGAGFIGSHLCSYLVTYINNFVICLDNLISGSNTNIANLLDKKNFIFVNKNVRDIQDLKLKKVDKIYHLACPASPPIYQNNPIDTLDTCYLGTKAVLELARLRGSRVLFTSTSEVYGDPWVSPQSEIYNGNVNPIGIRACYDEGKRISETLMFDYYRYYNVDITVARIFNTYGPNMKKNDGRVVTNFLYQALEENDITIYGDGSQIRSFCYISDMIDGLYKLMETKGEKGPINIGNPFEEFTIKTLADLIIQLTESESKIIYKLLPSDDPKLRCPYIKKACKYLRWYPQITLETGLKLMIEHYKSKQIN